MIVVTDTSVVLNLAWLRQETLLGALFDRVIAPPEVRDEFKHLALTDPRFAGLPFPAFIEVQAPHFVPAALADNPLLDSGERIALALALELRVTTVLLDEKIAREVAARLGLRAIGLLGILVEAKYRKLLREVRPLLDRLQKEAQFRIHSDLRALVLQEAGEDT